MSALTYNIAQNGPEADVRLEAGDAYGLISVSARALAELLGGAPAETSYERSGFIFAGRNRSDLLKRFWSEMIYHYGHSQVRPVGALASLFTDRELNVSVQFSARENGPERPYQVIKARCWQRPSGGWGASLTIRVS